MSQELETLIAVQTALEGDHPDAASIGCVRISDGEFRRQALLCQARWGLRRGMSTAASPWLEAARAAAPDSNPWIAQLWLEVGDASMARTAADAGTEPTPAGKLAGLASAVLAWDRAAVARHVSHLGSAWPGHPAVASALRAITVLFPDNRDGQGCNAPSAVWTTGPALLAANDALAWWLCSYLWEQAGDHSSAQECLYRAVAGLPMRLDWQYRLGASLIRHGSVERLPAVWCNPPVRFDGAPRWLMLSCRAWAHTGRTNERALNEARAAERLDPGFWPALSAQAHLLTGLASSDQIGCDFIAFMDRGPRVRHSRSHAKASCAPLAEDALKAGRAAVRLAPVAPVWNDLGAVLFATGDLPAAATAFQRALEIDPQQRHAAINFAIVLERTGQRMRLDRYLRNTRFTAALPDSLALRLRNDGLPSSTADHWPDLWRMPPTHQEWRRSAVFSQHWWRALPDLTSS